MADAYTTTGSVSTDRVVYDRLMYFALRPEIYFDGIADVKPADSDQRGSSVVFTITNDLAVAKTPLSESVDVDAVALSDSTVSLTLEEYGSAVVPTAKLRNASQIPIDPTVANAVGFNAGISIDDLVKDILQAGTNVLYASGGADTPAARNQVDADDTLSAHDVRIVRARLSAANVQRINGYYNAWIHGDVALDLREETGAAAWREPHNYAKPEEIWNGELGTFEGFRFMETPRAPLFANASDGNGGAGAIDVYRTLFAGRQALAKAHAPATGPRPGIVFGPVVDKLARFRPVGWYWMGAYGIFRQAALWGVESASSIGQ